MMTEPGNIRPQNVVREFLDGTQMVLLRPDEQMLWEHLIATNEHSHLLQSWAWGEIKHAFGWTPLRIGLWNPASQRLLAGAQALLRPLPLIGYSMAYVPKGPVLDWSDPSGYELFFAGLHAFLRSKRAAFLRVEPDLPGKMSPSMPDHDQALAPLSSSSDDGEIPIGGLYSMSQGNAVARHLCTLGFHPVQDAIQQLRTIVVDLTPDEETISLRQHKTRRYNANLAARKGVTVRQASSLSDLEQWFELFELTRKRDGFESRTFAYFQQLLDLLKQAGHGELFLAEYEGKLLAGALVTRVNKQSIYLYAASSNEGRKLMPNDLLQREIMRWAKNQGASLHDMWGIAATDSPDDPLAGVTHFKRGWGGYVVEYIGGFDYIYSPTAYCAFIAGRQITKTITIARAGFVRRRSKAKAAITAPD